MCSMPAGLQGPDRGAPGVECPSSVHAFAKAPPLPPPTMKHLTLILLANGEGLWWGNPLDRAEVEKSAFARAFLDRFVFERTEE